MLRRCLPWLGVVIFLSGCAAVFSTAPSDEQTPPPINAPTTAVSEPLPPASTYLLPEESPPAGAQGESSTNSSHHTVPYSEIPSGGPPKDGIPATDEPAFVTVEAADAWLEDVEPVVGVNYFWFSWAAFKPETRIYTTPSAGSPPVREDPAATLSTDDSATAAETATPEQAMAVDQLETDFDIRVYQGEDMLGGALVTFADILRQGGGLCVRRRAVLVKFWAGSCPLCRGSLPEVQALYKEFGDQVTVLALDVGTFTGLGDETTARALIRALGLAIPAGTIDEALPMQAYLVTGIPTP